MVSAGSTTTRMSELPRPSARRESATGSSQLPTSPQARHSATTAVSSSSFAGRTASVAAELSSGFKAKLRCADFRNAGRPLDASARAGNHGTNHEQRPGQRVSPKPAREFSPMVGLPDQHDGLPAQQHVLARLRQALALESGQSAGDSRLPLGIPSLDAALGGGLAAKALHEIAAAGEAEIPAATGFALILAACNPGPLVWIAEDMAFAENGAPYGPGLEE